MGLVILFSLTTSQAFSQQAVLTEEGLEFSMQENEEWVLGDVIALDLENKQLILGYIDYQANEEKEIVISVNSATDYTNVDSLKDIKIDAVVAIDYRISPEGEALALNIIVEYWGGGSI